MSRKYGKGEERDTRIVLDKEEEIRKLEYARLQVVKQIEENMRDYAKILYASRSEKKRLAKRAGGRVGRAKNDFKDIK